MPGGPGPMIPHMKRQMIGGPYPNDRRSHQQEQPSNNDPNNNNNNNNNSNNHHHNNNNSNNNNNNNGYNNRGWKRPCKLTCFDSERNDIRSVLSPSPLNSGQKPDGSSSVSATLEIRKIPVESNTISKLNEHFSKFGTVKNVQVNQLYLIARFHLDDFLFIRLLTMARPIQRWLPMPHNMKPKPPTKTLSLSSTIVSSKSSGITAIRWVSFFSINTRWNFSRQAQTSSNSNPSQSNQVQQQAGTSSVTDVSSSNNSAANAPNPKKLHWIKTQQQSAIKTEPSSAATSQAPATPAEPAPAAAAPVPKKAALASSSITKKDAAKKAAMELHRKKHDLLEEQIQQQKQLLKKLEVAENTVEKESIRALMKQVDATVVRLKDSLRITPPVKTVTPVPAKPAAPKISQQAVLKQRAQTLQKQIETLRAKTSADMVRSSQSRRKTDVFTIGLF